ncbi:MAG: ATP synthase F1 subunit epsilon [bacterium]|nr:ATP synthase F1 subunit epsilon [bacterium]
MKLEIVTPEKKAFEDEVDQVTLTTTEGQITVLPHHIPVFTQLASGEIVAKKAGKEALLASGGGFAEITGDKVSVLTDLADRPEEIDEKKVEEAKKRAEAAMKEKHLLSEEEFAATAAALEKALAQLKIKHRRRPATTLKTETSL